MRLLLDENFPKTSTIILASAGHDTLRIEGDLRGASDEDVLALARAEERILVTFDSDFGELIYHRHRQPPRAVIFLRFAPATTREPADTLLALLDSTNVHGHFVVVRRGGVRLRLLPTPLT